MMFERFLPKPNLERLIAESLSPRLRKKSLLSFLPFDTWEILYKRSLFGFSLFFYFESPHEQKQVYLRQVIDHLRELWSAQLTYYEDYSSRYNLADYVLGGGAFFFFMRDPGFFSSFLLYYGGLYLFRTLTRSFWQDKLTYALQQPDSTYETILQKMLLQYV